MTPTIRQTALMFVLIAAVYLAAVNDYWAIKPDSGLYLSLGRSLAEGRGMEFNGRQFWGIPPLLPFLVAGCRLIVGDHFWLINLVMVLTGLGVVVIAYLIVQLLQEGSGNAGSRSLVLAVTLTVALSAGFFTVSTRVLSDVPFTFFGFLGLYAFLRGERGHWLWLIGGALAMTAATGTRVLGLLLWAGAAAGILLGFRQPGYLRRIMALSAGGAVLLGAFLVWVFLIQSWRDIGTIDYTTVSMDDRLNLLAASKWKEIGESFTQFPGALCSSITDQKLNGFGASLIPTALLLVGAVTLGRRRQWVILLPHVFYLGFLVIYTPAAVAPRYFLAVMPLTVYAILVGVQTLAERWRARTARVSSQAPPRRFEWAVVLAAAVLVAISVPKIAREVYWLRHPQFYAVFEYGRWLPFIEAGQYLRDHGRPGDKFLARQSTVLHYLSRVGVSPQVEVYQRAKATMTANQFAEVLVGDSARFVILSFDSMPWAQDVASRLEASKAFRLPPVRFGGLTVYERKTLLSGNALPEQIRDRDIFCVAEPGK